MIQGWCQRKRTVQTDITDLKLFGHSPCWSWLCLFFVCCAPISFSPSLLLPAEVKMSHWVSSWSPSSPISPRIPQETSCRIATLWHHFPVVLLWTCSLQADKKACNDKICDDSMFAHVTQSVIYRFGLIAFCLNKPCVFNFGNHSAANWFYCHLSRVCL